MNRLTDRYVSEVLRSIPQDRRSDVEAELTAAIDDAIEGMVEAGENSEAAERAVLNDLGDPARLAADYSDKPLWLIGPTYYLAWLRLTRQLLMFIPITVWAVVAVVAAAGGEPLFDAIVGGFGAFLTAALNVVFWTTLGFAITERVNTGVEEDIAALTKWTVDRLPVSTVHDRQFNLGETIASLVVQAFVIIALVAQRSLDPVPVIKEEAWDLIVPVMIGLLVVSMIFEVVKYRARRWSTGLATVNAIINVGFVGWWVWAIQSDQLLNEEFFVNLGFLSSMETTATITALVVVAICGWDTIEGFVGAYKNRRAAHGS